MISPFRTKGNGVDAPYGHFVPEAEPFALPAPYEGCGYKEVAAHDTGIRLFSLQSRKCHIAGAEHRSNHVYIVLDERTGAIEQRCHSPRCAGRAKILVSGCADEGCSKGVKQGSDPKANTKAGRSRTKKKSCNVVPCPAKARVAELLHARQQF